MTTHSHCAWTNEGGHVTNQAGLCINLIAMTCGRHVRGTHIDGHDQRVPGVYKRLS